MNENSKPVIKVRLELCVWEVTETDCNLVEDKMIAVPLDGDEATTTCRLRLLNGKYETDFTVNGTDISPLD